MYIGTVFAISFVVCICHDSFTDKYSLIAFCIQCLTLFLILKYTFDISGKDVVKNIYLLNEDMETVPSNKRKLTQNGRKHAAFEIKSEDTEQAVRERIDTIFEVKIGHLPQPRYNLITLGVLFSA